MDTPPDAPRLSLLRRLLYAALTLLLFAALLEGALAVADVANPLERLSLTRGFSPTVHYFVDVPDQPGAVRTQMFNGESPEVAIPPKDERVRVMLFGESNTEGFREEVLEAHLEAAMPGTQFQVLNLGRHGYGSERVRILLTQALEYEPDVALIYLGHNEFIEAGFAAEISKQWQQPWLLRLTEKLSALRTMNLGVSLVERATSGGVAAQPESWQKRSQIFASMTWDKTQDFFGVYRENLDAMVTLCRDAGARVVMATMVGNDFDPPTVSTPPKDLPEDGQRQMAKLRQQAIALIPERFRHGIIPSGPNDPLIRLRPPDWGEGITRDVREERRKAATPHELPVLRPLTGELAAAPFWCDSATWLPPVFTLMQTEGEISARRLDAAERDALRQACERYESILQICPDIPLALYELGLCRWLLGEDDAAAAELLRRSIHFDRAPTRANDIINGIIRELAAARAGDAGVRFVDMEQWFRDRSPAGLVGYEVMMDNCHLHEASRAILVDQFVAPIVELTRDVLAER